MEPESSSLFAPTKKPAEVFKIDSLNKATPAQLRQLKDGLAVTDAMQEIRRAEPLAKEANPRPANGRKQ